MSGCVVCVRERILKTYQASCMYNNVGCGQGDVQLFSHEGASDMHVCVR